MRSLRIVAVCLSSTATSAVEAESIVDLPREFANCAGRYSAMVEHAWLMQDPDAGEYEHFRAAFLDLLESVGGTDPSMLDLRIEAKAAMSKLLSQAVFGTTAEVTERAADFARSALGDCQLMLLGG